MKKNDFMQVLIDVAEMSIREQKLFLEANKSRELQLALAASSDDFRSFESRVVCAE